MAPSSGYIIPEDRGRQKWSNRRTRHRLCALPRRATAKPAAVRGTGVACLRTLRRTGPRDQAAVAVLVLFGLLAMIGWWIGQGGLSGRLVEVEQAKPQQAQYLVDVNSADWPELAQLPGIGEVLARRIVEERTAGGPFRDLDDLQERVRGIGPATLERLRPFVAPLPPTTGLAEK